MDPLQGGNSCRKLCMMMTWLTASEVSKIITVSTGTRRKRKKNPDDCRMKTFRKVKERSSSEKRERSKDNFKNCSDANIEEKMESGPERRSVDLDVKGIQEIKFYLQD